MRPRAEKLTFTPGSNTSEVLGKDGNMNREVPFEVSNICISIAQYQKMVKISPLRFFFPKVSICEDVPPFVIDAAGLISWNDTKITSKNSAALHLKYTTQVEGLFSSTGGVLSTAPHSDVQIIIGNGAIAEGNPQRLFFNVICDETAPLQDILEGNTLISPVIECGPHDINLLKPVEIILPHCLYLKETKKKWISVYRTDTGKRKNKTF